MVIFNKKYAKIRKAKLRYVNTYPEREVPMSIATIAVRGECAIGINNKQHQNTKNNK